MKRKALLLLAIMLLAAPLFAAGYVGLSLSPFVDTGSATWSYSSKSMEFPSFDVYNFGLEQTLEVGLIGRDKVINFGTVFSLGIAFPLVSETGEDPDGIPIYTYAFNPAIVFTTAVNFTDAIHAELGLGFGMFFGFLSEDVEGGKASGSASHYLEYLASLAIQWDFSQHWALRGGVKAKVNSFIMPEVYRVEVKSTAGDFTRSSALSMIVHIQPFIGVAYLW